MSELAEARRVYTEASAMLAAAKDFSREALAASERALHEYNKAVYTGRSPGASARQAVHRAADYVLDACEILYVAELFHARAVHEVSIAGRRAYPEVRP